MGKGEIGRMDTEKCQACHIRQAEQIGKKWKRWIYIYREDGYGKGWGWKGRIRKRVGLERTDTEKGGLERTDTQKDEMSQSDYSQSNGKESVFSNQSPPTQLNCSIRNLSFAS